MHGLLNLNKPPGATSRQVVDRVKRVARPAKVGHAGTLDPLARGVLVVGTGGATRLMEYVQRMPKTYAATFLLGRESPTEDVEGEVTERIDPPVPTREQLVAAAQALTGTIGQRPPAYSALKIAGRRAYSLARQGQAVELEPRPVTVYRFDIVAYEYPELKAEITCGSGTYIRSLGRDLAVSLGTAAVMSDLVRTAIGDFVLDEAIDPDTLTEANWTDYLRPPLAAVALLPQLRLSDDQVARIRSGLPIAAPAETPTGTDEIAAIDATGRLTAILAPRGPGLLGPTKNLPIEA